MAATRVPSSGWFNCEHERKVECRHCGAPVKYSGNTPNLAANLSKRHPTVKVEPAEPAKDVGKQASLMDVGIRAVPHKKLPSQGARAQAIQAAIADFIMKDLRPLSVIEGEDFRALIELLEPAYDLPS